MKLVFGALISPIHSKQGPKSIALFLTGIDSDDSEDLVILPRNKTSSDSFGTHHFTITRDF